MIINRARILKLEKSRRYFWKITLVRDMIGNCQHLAEEFLGTVVAAGKVLTSVDHVQNESKFRDFWSFFIDFWELSRLST